MCERFELQGKTVPPTFPSPQTPSHFVQCSAVEDLSSSAWLSTVTACVCAAKYAHHTLLEVITGPMLQRVRAYEEEKEREAVAALAGREMMVRGGGGDLCCCHRTTWHSRPAGWTHCCA